MIQHWVIFIAGRGPGQLLAEGLDTKASFNGDFDLDTLKAHEYLTHVEFGWSPEFDRRKQDKIQFTWWQQDKRVFAGVEEGSGWLMTASRQMGQLTGFVRYGNSDGGGVVAATEAFSPGFACEPHSLMGPSITDQVD